MKTTIPTAVVTPPGSLQSGPKVYAALIAVDPTLVPREAVEAAQRGKRWAEHQPQRATTLREAVTTWGNALAAAMRSGKPLPATDEVAAASYADAVFTSLRDEYRRQWTGDTHNVGASILRHTDDIVVKLRPLWLAAVEQLAESVAAIPQGVQSAGDLLEVDGGAELYRRARAANRRCADIVAARSSLTLFTPQDLPRNVSRAVLIVKNPDALNGVQRDGDDLARWRSYITAITQGEPWMPTRDEAIAHHERLEAEARRGNAEGLRGARVMLAGVER